MQNMTNRRLKSDWVRISKSVRSMIGLGIRAGAQESDLNVFEFVRRSIGLISNFTDNILLFVVQYDHGKACHI